MAKDEIGCSRNGVDENGCSNSFEEQIYWNYFKSMRFFTSLPSDFHSQLMIPIKFSENMRNKLPQMVVLKSPGDAAWEVQLEWDKNNLFFRDGWKDFAKAHDLKENDLLIFKYLHDSCLKVWIFNERDSCEKASSYFVRKSTLGKTDAGESLQLKRKKTRENLENDESNKEETSARALRRKTRRQSCEKASSYVVRKPTCKPDAGENLPLKRKKSRENLENGSSDTEEASARDLRRRTRRQSCEKASSYIVRKSTTGKTDAGESVHVERKKSREKLENEDSVTEEISARDSRRKTLKQSCKKVKSYIARKSTLDKTDAGNSVEVKRKKFRENLENDDSDMEETSARDSRRNSLRRSTLDKTDAGESVEVKRKKFRENLENDDSNMEETAARDSRRNSLKQTVCGLETNGDYKKTPSAGCTPNREPPRKTDSEGALQLATREKTDESFIVVMKANNVSLYYRLGISAPWARNYIAQKNQTMELRRNGRSWSVRFNVEQRCGGGVLVSGWYNFVVDNSLQESDVCLFKLVSQKYEPAVFDVLIFRGDQPSHKPCSV